MANKSFDDIIKNKFDSFNMDVNSDSWKLFQEAQESFLLDKAVSDKVRDHQLEMVPKDWDILADKIEHTQKPLSFDEIIGAKIASLSINEGSDWNDFEQLLDKDSNFDKEVSEKVRNHQIADHDTQWPKLSEHLDKVEQRRRRIVVTKFVEAAVFILFIISIVQIFPIQNISKKKIFRTYAVTQDLNSSVPTVANKVEQDFKKSSPEKIADFPEIAIIPSFETVGDELAQNLISSTEASLKAIQTRNLKTIDNVNLISSEIKPVSTKLNNNIINDHKGIFSTEAFIPPINTDEALPSIASLEIPSIDYFRPTFVMPADANKDLDKGQLWFNLYGSPNANFISTPYDQYYGLEGYQSNAYGYTIGSSLSYETINWETGGGVAYTSLNFYPRPVTEIVGKANNGYSAITLKEVILDIVEIPLNFKFKLFRKKGWTLYSSSGLSAGFVASAIYDINEEVSAPLASRNPGQKSNNLSNTNPILRNKDFDPGLLNGGKFVNNIFATLNTGIGLTKKLSDGISFYVQPTYQHNLSISGLGPNNDVHHRLSLEIGTKVRL